MINKLVRLESSIGGHDFPANVARIGKITLEVFWLQMIPDILPGFVSKLTANSTGKFFQRIISKHNVLIKVFRIGNIASCNKYVLLPANFHWSSESNDWHWPDISFCGLPWRYWCPWPCRKCRRDRKNIPGNVSTPSDSSHSVEIYGKNYCKLHKHTFAEDHPEPICIGENLRDLLYQLLKN